MPDAGRCRRIGGALAGLALAWLVLGCRTMPMARGGALDGWPAAASPREIGARVARQVAGRPFGWEGATRPRSVSYPEVVSWYGALTFADVAHDTALRDRLIRRIDTLRTPDGARHVSQSAHVDARVFGTVPLEISILNGDPALRAWGLSFADRQWEHPSPDGITREARYWVDDMYMSTIVQLEAYRATGNRAYLDRSATMMVAYLDSLQQPDGLFHHAADSPFNWGRGNGWFAAGMAEMLRSLPADHPLRGRITAGYTKMMAALLRDQAPDGLWRQLVDKPESWVETSGSGMFAFAMVTGVKEGWLDAAVYGPAARRAWLGLVRHIDANGEIDDVCVGTNKAQQEVGSDLQKQYDYYLARPRHTGDLHGEAPVLWTATALLR